MIRGHESGNKSETERKSGRMHGKRGENRKKKVVRVQDRDTPQHKLSNKVSRCFVFFTNQVLCTGPCHRNVLASAVT